jgi:hypothetical protein
MNRGNLHDDHLPAAHAARARRARTILFFPAAAIVHACARARRRARAYIFVQIY